MLPLKDDIPSRRFPFVTVVLIVINVAVYFYQLSLGHANSLFIWKYAVVPKAITSLHQLHPNSTIFPPLTLLTSQFLHGGFLHLGSNMLFLWIFGDNIEDKLGHLRFVLFYLACGAISAVIQIATFPGAEVPIIGASGAIAGVMGAYFLRFPYARVQTLIIIFFFIRIIRIPAVVFLGFWFIFQMLLGIPTLGVAEGGVAYFAHIGGFVVGMILFKLMEKYK
ncbi:MAG: rhomboid family intramembrane serine protease [candidate division Zixibacteria bacterium 4484_95]|nr:MAG: rhomboid family intramembrane serine protease [candidate division Zixibacteria bacterium 4484_95]